MDESGFSEAEVEATLTGRLLVASPELGDPNFSRTVVLLVDHDESGALGVVLNRPSTTDVGEILPEWHLYAAPPQVVFQGGPVGRDSALALASRLDGKGEDGEPLGFRHVHAGIGLIDLDGPAELIAGEITSMRVFAGYAGWGSDQLEAEIDQGAWFVVDAEPQDLASTDPEQLWTDVLRRQPPPLAVVATFPEDPTMN
ncbi:MAG TPA: YqgE/AlgH family protein [Actinomycetes bacterium]|nr:YqgE/AlgH family protein [Actinomycetes bacterium]